MQRKISTKAMVEGAMLLGILVVLGLLTLVPPFSFFSFVLLPTPILFAALRHNIKLATMVGILSVFVLIIVGVNPYSALITGIYSSFIGLALGYGFQKKLKPTIILVITATALIMAILLIAYLAAGFLELNIIEEMIDMQIEMMEMVAEKIQARRPPGEQQGDKEVFLILTKEQIRFLFPGLLVLAAFVNSFVTISIIRQILKKFNIETQPFPKFSHWKFGDWLIWTFVAAQLINLFIPSLQYITMNVMQVAFYAVILQGLAVIYFWLSKRIQIKAIKVMIVVFILLSPFLHTIAMLIGILDFFWNFRRI